MVPKSLGAFLQPDLADGEDESINEDIIKLHKKLKQVKFLSFLLLKSIKFPKVLVWQFLNNFFHIKAIAFSTDFPVIIIFYIFQML